MQARKPGSVITPKRDLYHLSSHAIADMINQSTRHAELLTSC